MTNVAFHTRDNCTEGASCKRCYPDFKGMTDAQFHALFTKKPAVEMGPPAARKITADRFARVMYYYVDPETEFLTEFCGKRLAKAVNPPLFSKMLEA